jgi:hypothetical protein
MKTYVIMYNIAMTDLGNLGSVLREVRADAGQTPFVTKTDCVLL